MKNFIGIDFAKEKFDVALITSEFTANHQVEHGVFDNNKDGFRDFLKWVKGKYPKAKTDDLLFCGENTGVYSRDLSEFLVRKGYPMYLENAYRIKQSSGLIRGKSDRQDALMIAEYILRNPDKAMPYRAKSTVLVELDKLFKQRRFLVKQNTEIECKLHSIDFGSSNRKSLQGRLDKYCLVKDNRITVKLDKAGKLGIDEMLTINLLTMLEINKMQIAELDRKMTEVIKQDESLLENYEIIISIPGMALQNASALLVYTENFERFGYNARKLASFYGVAVFGKQSGSSVHSGPHTSHLSNRMLKSLLHQAALAAIHHCEPIRGYYARMTGKGKNKQIVINNVKNKLLHMVMSMIRNKTKYDANAYGHSAELYNTQMTPEFF